MKQYAPLIAVILAILVALLSVLGDDSYARLSQLKSAIMTQKEKNDVLRGRVEDLRGQVAGLQTTDRSLEKAARNELGMARPNEMIFLFDDSRNKSADSQKARK